MANTMTLRILPTGTMHGDLTWLLMDPAQVVASRNDRSKAAKWVGIPTHCVFIDHPEGKVLFDTGVPRDQA